MRAAQYKAIRLQEQLAKLSDAELADQARALLLQVQITSPGGVGLTRCGPRQPAASSLPAARK